MVAHHTESLHLFAHLLHLVAHELRSLLVWREFLGVFDFCVKGCNLAVIVFKHTVKRRIEDVVATASLLDDIQFLQLLVYLGVTAAWLTIHVVQHVLQTACLGQLIQQGSQRPANDVEDADLHGSPQLTACLFHGCELAPQFLHLVLK